MKWKTLQCYTIVHEDHAYIDHMAFAHESIFNENTGTTYMVTTMRHIVCASQTAPLVTFVYGRPHYDHFLPRLNATKILETYRPLLPIPSTANSENKNDTWRRIERQQDGLFWTHACRSGIQYQNNGVVSAKRTVLSLLGKTW